MSLLGKLFSGSSSSGPSQSRATNPLDSNLEDQFTYNLLFPDAEALCHSDQIFHLSSSTVLAPATSNAFDTNGEIDLEMRDVRIIIMQEATPVSGSAYVLYDSHAPPCAQSTLDRQGSTGSTLQSRSEARRSISSPRKSSIGQIPRPLSQEIPQRLSAFDRRPNQRTYETEGQRSAREYKEEVGLIASCIFGSSDVWANKSTQSKVHVLPSEATRPTSMYMPDGSLGRSSLRSSKLAQSYTSETMSLGPTHSPRGERKKVLITRMFPVPLPVEDTTDDSTPTPANKENTSYPFPKVGEKPPQPKQKRTPMYAIGLVVNLPASHAPPAATSRSSFRGPSSYNEESCPSSFNSARRAGWSMVGIDSLDSSFCSESDDHIDITTRHSDIIIRSLSYLQAIITATLLPMLKHADASTPSDPHHVRTSSASVALTGKRLEDLKLNKPPKTNAKLVYLAEKCLLSKDKIKDEVQKSRQRITSGIKATQVVTGQGRWAIWREEARIVHSWAGGRDQGFFFSNLLTGFLGTHTDWLHALGPKRKYKVKDDDISIPARTIVVSNEKIAARRLIFLLAAFLPANHPSMSRPHRPSSASFQQSQSPPKAGVPILKEEPLHRRINNKRAGAMKIPQPRFEERRSSVNSIKTANLPIPGSDMGTIKNVTATTSTATPVNTMPHFSNRRPVRGTGPTPRPESSGSLIAEDLLRSLKRGDSSGQSSGSQGWGSMISGFWGSKRRDSSATDFSPTAIDFNDPQAKNKLSRMVDEAERDKHNARETNKSETASTKTAKAEEVLEAQDSQPQFAQTIRVPDPAGAFESPVKTSINADGVIDIDVPLPDYLSSFETAVSSPSSSGYLSTPGFGNGVDAFEYNARFNSDSDTTLNVGGWLPDYHPDYALQAVPSQADLIDEIKASMRSEPTPIIAADSTRWVDVTSALIADTTNFTIKRIIYQRLLHANHEMTPRHTQAITPSVAEIYDGRAADRFVEEAVISMDETLIEAIEKVLVQSSKTSSASSSRSQSRGIAIPKEDKTKRRERSDSDAGSRKENVVIEVHRNECKKIILGALEEVTRNVMEEMKMEEEEKSPLRTRQRGRRERASLLREGVRTWLGGSGDGSYH